MSVTRQVGYIDTILTDLAGVFKTPIPRYVLGARCNGAIACYDEDSKTILFPKPPSAGVIAHEFGHAVHDHYHIRGGTREYETFANFVEEWYLKSRGLHKYRGISPLKCPSCKVPMPYGNPYTRCFKCKTLYKTLHPQVTAVVIPKAVIPAVAGALLMSAIYGKFPPKTREEWGMVIGACTASTLTTLIALILTG